MTAGLPGAAGQSAKAPRLGGDAARTWSISRPAGIQVLASTPLVT
jgi:hypothetical protein